MVNTTLLIVLILINIPLYAQQVSIGYRTGASKWVVTDLYRFSIRNSGIGAKVSWDNEAFVIYKTKEHFAIESGLCYFEKYHQEDIRGRNVTVRSRNLEIYFAPQWWLVKHRGLYWYVGGDFSLVNDFTSEKFSMIDDYGYRTYSNNSFTDARFYMGFVSTIGHRFGRRVDIQCKGVYKLDVDKVWGNETQYANSRMGLQLSSSYQLN